MSLKSDEPSLAREIARQQKAQQKEHAQETTKKILTALGIIAARLIGLFYPFKSPAEKISGENFMYHHSAEEIVEYWAGCGDMQYIAEIIAEETYREYY